MGNIVHVFTVFNEIHYPVFVFLFSLSQVTIWNSTRRCENKHRIIVGILYTTTGWPHEYIDACSTGIAMLYCDNRIEVTLVLL